MTNPDKLPADIAAAIQTLETEAWHTGYVDGPRDKRSAARAALNAAILARLTRAERLEAALRFTDATVTAFMDWLDKEAPGLEAPLPLALAMIDARQKRDSAIADPAPAEEMKP